jgi:hypothetical protein
VSYSSKYLKTYVPVYDQENALADGRDVDVPAPASQAPSQVRLWGFAKVRNPQSGELARSPV